MKKISLFLFCFTILKISAQPTLTSSWAPAPGQQFELVNFNAATLSEGSAGINMTWDLSTPDTSGGGSFHATVVQPSSGVQSSLFPSATSCLLYAGGADYEYYQLAGNRYQILGGIQPGGTGQKILYSKPMSLFRFPFSYQNSFSDTGRSIQYATSPNDTTKITTTETARADGYGTLITRSGTYQNVLRINLVQTEVDSDITQHSVTINTYNTFLWLSPTIPGVILALVNHASYGGIPQDQGYYAFTTSTGIESLASIGISSWSLAPQPTTGTATIFIQNADQEKIASISISDLTGREVMTTQQILPVGYGRIPLIVTPLADGLYILTMSIDGIGATQKLMVKH